VNLMAGNECNQNAVTERHTSTKKNCLWKSFQQKFLLR
jgi:hypothetical protein